jgi:hypothetical protein
MKSGRPREFEWNHALILVKAVFTMALLFYPVWWIHVHLVAGRLPTLPLSLAVSFLGVQILVVLVEVLASSATKKLDAMERRRSTHFRSVVQRALAVRRPDLAKLRRRRPADFDWCVAALLGNVMGPERVALSKLAVRLGVVRHWQRFSRRGPREYKHALEWMAALSLKFPKQRCSRYSGDGRPSPKPPPTGPWSAAPIRRRPRSFSGRSCERHSWCASC